MYFFAMMCFVGAGKHFPSDLGPVSDAIDRSIKVLWSIESAPVTQDLLSDTRTV